jgi:hypothetical protein
MEKLFPSPTYAMDVLGVVDHFQKFFPRRGREVAKRFAEH